MIRINELQFTYPGADQPALQIDHLQIPAASFCLLSGQSGSGKSTLLRLINGLVPHFSGGTVSGNILVNESNPMQAGPQMMSRQVGFVFQNPENQFVVDVVEDEIAFSLENAAIPRPEMRLRIQSILEQLQITNLRHRKIHSLSGGEAQRVAIAAALVLQPPILLLDEPTSQLDPFAAQEVLTLLEDLRTRLRLTILLAEQRLDRVLPYATQLVHLRPQGTSILSGAIRKVLAQSELQPPLVQLAIREGWNPLPVSVQEARKFVATRYSANKTQTSILENKLTQPAIQVENLSVSYPHQPALHQVSFVVQCGERVVIMGPNGAGKTSLLRSLVGLVKPQSGNISILCKSIAHQTSADICRQVGFLPQDPNALLFAESVQAELEITLQNHGLPPDRAAIDNLLKQLLLKEKSQAYPRDLSTGERQRTALGAIAIAQPRILLLDEPTRGLDPVARQALLGLLNCWNDKGMTILLVTHDVEFAATFATRIIILEEGRVMDDGDPHQVMHNHPRYRTQIAQLFPGSGWLTVEDVNSG